MVDCGQDAFVHILLTPSQVPIQPTDLSLVWVERVFAEEVARRDDLAHVVYVILCPLRHTIVRGSSVR